MMDIVITEGPYFTAFSLTHVLISAALAAVICVLCVKKQALTVSGAAAAGVLIVLLTALGSLSFTFCLIFAYAAIAVTDALVDRGRKKEHSPRSARQVSENGTACLICALFFGLTDAPIFAAGFAAALCQALCDSLSSDVGILSKLPPVDVFRMKKAQRGVSGAMSFLGTAAGAAGSLVCAVFCMFVLGLSLESASLCAAAGFFGMVLDSAMGSLLQGKFRCRKCGRLTEKRSCCGEKTVCYAGLSFLDNGTVNLICNLLTAAAVCILA